MSTFNCWMCRHPNIKESKDRILINSIISENDKLECPICYDILDSNNLFFSECKHYACYKCINSIIKKKIDNQMSRQLLILDQSIIDDQSIQIPLIIDDQHTRGRLVLHNNFNLTQVVVNNNSSRVPILIYIISIIYIFMIVYVIVNQ